MKYKFLVLAFLAIFLNETAPAQSKKESQVAKAVEQLKNAMISGNANELSVLVTNDLTYGHSGGKIESKAEFVQAFADGRTDFVTINLTNQTINVFKKTAVVRHHLNATNNDSGKPGTVKLSVISVWRKEAGKWKMMARQAVKLPS